VSNLILLLLLTKRVEVNQVYGVRDRLNNSLHTFFLWLANTIIDFSLQSL